jgi:hypothetical protein
MSAPPSRSASSAALAQLRQWCDQVQAAVQQVFGDHPPAPAIRQLCRQVLDEAQLLLARTATVAVPVVLLGRTASGKGWLARCFLRDPALRSAIPSGQNSADRSAHLLWIGPQPPPQRDEGEQYLPASAEQMLDLGVPYCLGDAPGFSTYGEGVERLHRRALASAALKILVLPQESLRDAGVVQLLRQLPAARVLPAIRFRHQPGQTLPREQTYQDVLHHYQLWQQAAPATTILPPLWIPDADCYDPHDPNQAIAYTQKLLRDTLTPLLADAAQRQQTVEGEIQARHEQLRRSVEQHLEEFRQRLQPLLAKIDDTLYSLLPQLTRQMFGEDVPLAALVRVHLRAHLLHHTPPWCFPYRSILGLLILTSNAWDRLIFTLTGSLPSLAAVVWQSWKNVRTMGKALARQRLPLAAYLQQQAREALAVPLQRLRQTLAALRDEEIRAEQDSNPGVKVRIAGLEEFQNRCRHLLEQTLTEYTARRRSPWLFALFATLAFLFFFSGPVVVIYRQYIETLWQVFRGEPVSWSDFPRPDFSMILTSFILSVIPVALIAMAALTGFTRRRWVEHLASTFRHKIDALTEQWQQQALLRLELHDPHWEAVQRLLHLDGVPAERKPPESAPSSPAKPPPSES